MVWRNLPLFKLGVARDVPGDGSLLNAPISVLIPARNEQDGIEAAIRSVLQSTKANFELIVMDDHSTDRTGDIVRAIQREDRRVRLEAAPELAEGWNGKQHACWHLAQRAQFSRLLFLDADVRLLPDALERLEVEMAIRQVALLSGFPRQITITLAEKLMIPLMHFVLLGYLPLKLMRSDGRQELGAGCGQLFLAEREAYFSTGGHAAIRDSRHDGLKLPRSFRNAGFKTDVIDASSLASVRMYAGWSQVFMGLIKNATEGLANRRLIVLFTILLLGASSLPILSLAHALAYGWPTLATSFLLGATVLSFVPRTLLAARLSQSWLGACLHPLAIIIFLMIQWYAFIRELLGMEEVMWRGRR
jgi:cellulose synthase/poly-beta-1,6-N-acetylglucosamine synthase-like glycosyltransferase